MKMDEEDWAIDCSDNEKYEVESKEGLTFNSDDILGIIHTLECNSQYLELEWQCPGRRGPSPEPLNDQQQVHHLTEFDKSSQLQRNDDFDFMDEMASPRLPVRRIGQVTPKGSAKKKTASFNGVLTTMLRHRRLEQQEINCGIKNPERNAHNMKSQST